MNTEDLLDYLSKGTTDDELLLMCQAAVDEMGAQQFMDTLKPAADEALQLYEERLAGVEQAYRGMRDDVTDRVIRIGVLAGTLLDAPLDKLDIVTSLALLIDYLTDAKDQVEWLTEQNSLLEGQVEHLQGVLDSLDD